MVDQEDIIALTKHVRSFSDALNNLRNTFKDSFVDGHYDDADCQSCAHNRLSDVLRILKGVLNKYPPLHSPDILSAAANIIAKIKQYNYSDGEEGPTDFYAAIDQLALSFSSSVSDFLMGDKEMTSPTMNQYPDSFGDIDGDEEFDSKFFERSEYEGESEKNDESEDSLEKNVNVNEPIETSTRSTPDDQREEFLHMPANVVEAHQPTKVDNVLQRTDELDKTLRSMEGSVDIALQRTKVWSKYAKDILSYLEKRASLGIDYSRQSQKLAQQTRNSIIEGSYLPFQSTFVTALDNDIQFALQCQSNAQGQLQSVIDKLSQRQKEHDSERSKIKSRWKAEVKRVNDSRDNLKQAKKSYMQKQKELEKFSKQLESKDEKGGGGGFSIGKKKHPEEIMRNAEESEEYYKHCVDDANFRQSELERTKQEVLIELRQLIYQCDLTMKSVTVSYFQLMHNLISPLPIQFGTLVETSSTYVEGQQFADFVRLQQSTSNQAMSPTYFFEKFRGEGEKHSSLIKHGEVTAISNVTSGDMFSLNPPSAHGRRSSFNDIEYRSVSPGNKKPQLWGKQKGSATDDTDSISSRSLPSTPPPTPPTPRATKAFKKFPLNESDEENVEVQLPKIPKFQQKGGIFKNQNLSEAAKMHKFRNVRSPSKCKECDSYVYFNGAECEKCGIICHKKCLENLNIKCGNKKLPRKMTTFGVDFHLHLASTKRKDVPYIIEKCIGEIDEHGLEIKGLYRVSGVKSKVEKLCQQFETGGDLVDLSNTPPHFIASVLKLYLRQLPEPLLTFKRYQDFIQVAKDSMFLKVIPTDLKEMSDTDANKYEEIIKKVHEIVLKLPTANYCTAAKLICHLKRVSEHSHLNQMGADNLAIIFGPTLLRPEGSANSLAAVMDMTHQTRAIELLINNSRLFMTDDDTELSAKERRENRRRAKKKHHSENSECSQTGNQMEHIREKSDMSVGAEFSQELLDLVGNTSAQNSFSESFGRGGETIAEVALTGPERETTLTDPPPPFNENTKAPVKMSLEMKKEKAHEDYDNLAETISESEVSPTSDKTSSIPTPDDVEIQSHLSYFDAILGVDSTITNAQSEKSNTSIDQLADVDDDEWLNQFGKDINGRKSLSRTPLQDSPRSASVRETKTSPFPNVKKKNSASSRLETTSYFFSIGGAENSTPLKIDGEGVNENVTINVKSSNMGQDDSGSFAKRDSKQRVPVRKLKPVSIKSSTVVTSLAGRQTSPESLPFTLKSTPFGLDENRVDEDTQNELSKDETDNVNTETIGLSPTDKPSNVDLSPTQKQAPAVLPKPKKPLDKKSWTADLIKSKSQSINEQPQPGSLNDRLMQNRKSDDPKTRVDNRLPATGNSFNNKSVKEIRTAFQNTPTMFDGNVSPPKSDTTKTSITISSNNNNNNIDEKYV